MKELIPQYVSSVCELKTMANELIAPGYIQRIWEDSIEVRCKVDDRLPLLRVNEAVKLTIYNELLGLQILVGKVFLSNEFFVRIVGIESMASFEKRNFFRVRVDMDGNAFLPFEENGEEKRSAAIPVRVSNLSLSGLFLVFQQERRLLLDEKLFVELSLATPQQFVCRVRRLEESGSVLGYGCEFQNCGEKQLDVLCAFLFERQREQLRNARESR